MPAGLQTLSGVIPGALLIGDGLFNGYAPGWAPFLLMLAMLLLLGVLLWLAALLWTTWIIHRPPRMTAGRALARLGRASPADVGLQFEEMVFNVADTARPGSSLALAAWWIPHAGAGAARRTCILLHGYGDSRAGSLAWARLWQDAGFHLLLLDLRAHGDSGGNISGGGVWERNDLHGVIDQLRHRLPMPARALLLFGVSFGGMIAAACAAERDDICALVIDSPVEGWASATRRYAQLLGLPLQHAHDLRLRIAQQRLGVRFDEVRPAAVLPHVRCPILAILPQTDVLVSPGELAEMAQAVRAAGASNRVWHAPGSHNLAIAEDPEQYRRKISEFVESLRWLPP